MPWFTSHILIDSSLEQERRKLPEFMKATPDTSCSWPSSVFVTVNVYIDQSLIFISVAQEARVYPLGEKATKLTLPECPFKVRSCSPYSKSHILTVASSPAEATKLYIGWIASLVTLALCPVNVYF
jgi:hypothetical protein